MRFVSLRRNVAVVAKSHAHVPCCHVPYGRLSATVPGGGVAVAVAVVADAVQSMAMIDCYTTVVYE